MGSKKESGRQKVGCTESDVRGYINFFSDVNRVPMWIYLVLAQGTYYNVVNAPNHLLRQ
jgi:hypothetical protein